MSKWLIESHSLRSRSKNRLHSAACSILVFEPWHELGGCKGTRRSDRDPLLVERVAVAALSTGALGFVAARSQAGDAGASWVRGNSLAAMVAAYNDVTAKYPEAVRLHRKYEYYDFKIREAQAYFDVTLVPSSRSGFITEHATYECSIPSRSNTPQYPTRGLDQAQKPVRIRLVWRPYRNG